MKEDTKKSKPEEDEKNILADILEITSKLAPIVLPMISYLGELEIED